MTAHPTLRLTTVVGDFYTYAEGTVTRALQQGQWWDQHLKPIIDGVHGGWAVDIGAHIGWFSHYLNERHTRVYACEPWPQSFALLEKNLLHHGDYGVHAWPVAVYARPCTLGRSGISPDADPGGYGYTPGPANDTVVGVRLDDYLPADAPISLVKCDAQGADLQALLGMKETIRRCRPTILFEWEEALAQEHCSNWDDYEGFFDRIGYQRPQRITTSYWDYVARPK